MTRVASTSSSMDATDASSEPSAQMCSGYPAMTGLYVEVTPADGGWLAVRTVRNDASPVRPESSVATARNHTLALVARAGNR